MASADNMILNGVTDDLSNFAYTKPKINSVGGKSIGILNKKTNKSVFVSTPLMLTWGINEYVDEQSGKRTYDMSLQSGADESDDFFTIQLLTGDDTPHALVNALEQNYPNPFNGTTTINYSLAERSRVSLVIYDASGRLVKTLESSVRDAGRHQAVWRGDDDAGRAVSSGVYFCRIAAGTFTSSRKIVYLR